MKILQNITCTGVIPGQPAGTVVEYRVNADDILENVLTANGSYPVKYASTLNLTQIHMKRTPVRT